MHEGFFITGTDTNVGKTIVSAILVNKLDAVYHKPIQCGLNKNGMKDSDIIFEICKKKTIIKETYFFKKPLSPNIAAVDENVMIDIKKLKQIQKVKSDKKMIVEGAGGLHVPINKNLYLYDFANIFKLPVILVCRTRLGTINHTLLSIKCIKEKNINLFGLVFVGEEEPETIETILYHGKKIYGKGLKILARIPIKKTINKVVIDNLKKLFISI